MYIFTQTIEDIAPNSLSDYQQLPIHFAFIRDVVSPAYGGIVLPPTKFQFIDTWNSRTQRFFCFQSQGHDFEEHKENLRTNIFPYFKLTQETDSYNKFVVIKSVTWCKIIMALNMYGKLYEHFHPQNYPMKIDFVGSAGDDSINKNKYEILFENKTVLYLGDKELHYLMSLTEEDQINETIEFSSNNSDRNKQFWDCIFEIYDLMLLKMKKDFGGKHIAKMMNDFGDLIPNNIKRSIYDVCVSCLISSPL